MEPISKTDKIVITHMFQKMQGAVIMRQFNGWVLNAQ